MKKVKLYSLVFSAVLTTLIGVVFSGATIYFLWLDNSSNAGIFATLIAIPLTIAIPLWSYILKKVKRNNLIERYLNDDHFVDRDAEYTKLTNLIHNETDRIIYIKGKWGMGKSLFMKMACDRINYTEKKKWKSYAAFYYNNIHTKKIIESISNKFCGNPNASVADISNCLNSSIFENKCILFIDNIYEIDLIECIEFAKAFINCDKNNQVVIAVDSNENEFHICPGMFSENEIDLLAQSYNTRIEKAEINKISELSNGYPVYARYSVEAYTKGIKIVDYNNFDVYIEALIDSLNNMEKESLSLIICLSQLVQDGVEVQIIYGIDNRITQLVIKKLITVSLINMYRKKIYTDKLISLKCMDFLAEYKNESYYKLYTYYKGFDRDSYIALVAALKSNFKYEHAIIKKILHKQYEENNFYLLISIGELDLNAQINPYLREDKECWTYVKYYYLKSLLELGLYDKAREIVDDYNRRCDDNINILNIQNDLDFEYQYLLVDLDHLTNYLKDAITFSYALSEKASTKEQEIKCRYLYAHCLRHIGENLEEAFNIFINLANDKTYANDKIRIRSIYSAASIKMFHNDFNYMYEEAFDEIEKIMNENSKNEIWKPYVDRHKAIYEYKLCGNFENAEIILQRTIDILEVTPLRIKYDIFFELGELYRIWGKDTDKYEMSLNCYSEALHFAERVHDYNLQSNSQLGILLLNAKYGYKTDNDTITTIISETQKIGLNINCNYALYVKYIIFDEYIPNELICYWKKMNYSDLLLICKKSKSEKFDLKLTVM